MTEPKPRQLSLNAALAAFQADLPRIAKDATADTGSYKYAYADLATVSEKVMPLLGKHGLAFTAFPSLGHDGKFVLAYSLVHSSGEERSGVYPLPDKGTPQQIGSAITYGRRYCLCAVIGVAPGGEDDDGAAAGVQHTTQAMPAEEAAPAEHSEDQDDGDWGVWDDVIKDITTPEEADQADKDLREVFKTGAMGPTKAANIRAAIKGRKAEVAGPRSPNGRHQEEVPA